MLVNLWNKTLGKVYELAEEKGNKKVIKITDRIIKIPKNV